jgi:hypothetical protein
VNSWAEQQAIVQELIDTLDATLVGPDVQPLAMRKASADLNPSGPANVSGLERARQLAAQAISLQPDPVPEQPELFE